MGGARVGWSMLLATTTHDGAEMGQTMKGTSSWRCWGGTWWVSTSSRLQVQDVLDLFVIYLRLGYLLIYTLWIALRSSAKAASRQRSPPFSSSLRSSPSTRWSLLIPFLRRGG